MKNVILAIILAKNVIKEFKGTKISLVVKSWFLWEWKPLIFGGWHPPIVMVGSKFVSQGIVPDAKIRKQLKREKS